MNILNKVHIHSLYYLVAFISLITGLFKEFIIFTFIIGIHEIGHLIPAYFYKWKIEKIVVLPFGGITIFNEHINRPMKEEFVITIMGPLFQIFIFFIIGYLFTYNEIFYNYHYAILFFNLIPIYPLDGSKLINILFNKLSSFKKSHLFSVYLSYISLIIVFVLLFSISLNLLFILVLLFLFLKVFDENKKHNYIFNKFLFERYLYKFNFHKRKVINETKLNKMKRDYKHLFYFNNNYHTEESILNKKFDK